MKWLLVLCSLYILVLSGIPCDCREDCFADEVTAPVGNHHDHRKKDCPCSPFFACSTCHGVIVPDGAPVTSRQVHKDKQVFFAYAEQPVHRFPFTIFQPPRLPA